MKDIVENLTRRPVTLIGNSGKAYHLPPRHALELLAIEIRDNAFVHKLTSRNVLAVRAGELKEAKGEAESAVSKDKRKKDEQSDKPKVRDVKPTKPPL